MSTFRRKQFYDNSCGAATLLCAAGELGITHLPHIPNTMLMGQELQSNNTCESAIYYMTCGASLGPTPFFNLEKGGYSFPHNIVFAGRMLGLDAEVYMENACTSGLLKALYPRCEQLCAQSGVLVKYRKRPALLESQRALKIMGVMKLLGLHYVMERPNGTYMDPADGRNFPDLKAMNNSWAKCYAETGISIVLQKA
ncbi:hypothetical protein AKI39_23080 [Bordetella sp. H567]|uniref:hypothetical protein n=1 Tax=Bordetella sp. H567 TaxID=1697043 RepID=UPI00081C50D6|nr:hypothetical protein [Bordetella sp. H567]AOB33011.1 hypothetical protein AKI39_23080 [Bordetella sp. H567]